MVTHTKPKLDPKGRFGVVETARILGIHRTTVWRWVEKGWLRPSLNSSANRTFFLGADIMAAWDACF